MGFQGIKTTNKLPEKASVHPKLEAGLTSDLNSQLTSLSQIQRTALNYYPRNVWQGDFNQDRGGLICNGRQNPLNLKPIIDHENPVLVKLRVEISHPTLTNVGLEVWPAIYATNPNRFYCYSQTAGVFNCAQFELPLDQGKLIYYTGYGSVFTLAQINILGWWGE